MEFAPIYFEPVVYTKLIAPITKEVNRFDTWVHDEVVEELTTAKQEYDFLSERLAKKDLYLYEELSYYLGNIESALHFVSDIPESGRRVADARRCITAMLKDVYLWLHRYNVSEALEHNSQSQKFIGEADKYLEKNNQLHIQ